MEYAIATRLHDEVLEIEISGKGGGHNADAIAREVIEAVQSAKVNKVLIDVRPFQGRMSIAETFFHVRRYPRDLSRVTTAVVDSKANQSFYSFFETAAVNLGFPLRYFNEAPEATAWLHSKRPT